MRPPKEIELHRRNAEQAMDAIKRDLERLKEAVVSSVAPNAVFERYPLGFVGGAIGLGFLFGFRRGRGDGRMRSIAEAVAASPQLAAATAQTVEASKPSIVGQVLRAVLPLAAKHGADYLSQRFMASNGGEELAPEPHLELPRGVEESRH